MADPCLHQVAAMAIYQRKLVVGGMDIHVAFEGEGPAVVLLHGLGESWVDWRWSIPTLARDFAVFAPDLPGCGRSTLTPTAYDPEFFAGVVLDLLDALELPRAVLVGNSLGGLAAIRAALRAPQRVSALVLAAPAGMGTEVDMSLRWPTVPGIGESISAWALTPGGAAQRVWLRSGLMFARPTAAPAAWYIEQYWMTLRPGLLAAWLNTVRHLVGPEGQRDVIVERLEELAPPALVVWGRDDRVVPHHQADDMMRRLRRGQRVILDDCGHLPQIEQSAAFTREVLQFLASCGLAEVRMPIRLASGLSD